MSYTCTHVHTSKLPFQCLQGEHARIHTHYYNEWRSLQSFSNSGGKWERRLEHYLPPSSKWGFPDSAVGKESACNAGDPSWIRGSGRSPGEWIGYSLQYSWASLVAQLVENRPAYGRPGFDPWVGKIPWRRESLPTPVFWPGEFHGLYSPWGRKESDMTK